MGKIKIKKKIRLQKMRTKTLLIVLLGLFLVASVAIAVTEGEAAPDAEKTGGDEYGKVDAPDSEEEGTDDAGDDAEEGDGDDKDDEGDDDKDDEGDDKDDDADKDDDSTDNDGYEEDEESKENKEKLMKAHFGDNSREWAYDELLPIFTEYFARVTSEKLAEYEKTFNELTEKGEKLKDDNEEHQDLSNALNDATVTKHYLKKVFGDSAKLSNEKVVEAFNMDKYVDYESELPEDVEKETQKYQLGDVEGDDSEGDDADTGDDAEGGDDA